MRERRWGNFMNKKVEQSKKEESEVGGPTQPTQPGNRIRFGRACVHAHAEKTEMLI